MKPLRLVCCATVLLLVPGCQDKRLKTDDVGTKPLTPVPPKRTTMSLKPETIDQLLLFPHYIIATVRCDDFKLLYPGTQSQQARMQTSVVEAGVGSVQGALLLNCFTNEADLMKRGNLYLIAAYGRSPEWWTMAERVEVSASEASEALHNSVQMLKDRLNQNPPKN